MQKALRNFFIAILLGLFTVTSAQLPPKIIADKHLIHAEHLYAAKDYTEAFNVMGKIIALQKEHNLTLDLTRFSGVFRACAFHKLLAMPWRVKMLWSWCSSRHKTKARQSPPIDGLFIFFGSPNH